MPSYPDGSPMTQEHAELYELGNALTDKLMDFIGKEMPDHTDARVLAIALGNTLGCYVHTVHSQEFKVELARNFCQTFFAAAKTAQIYQQFIKSKIKLASQDGFAVADSEINPLLKPFQRKAVQWAVAGGRRALFERFGLGKTVQQLEILRLILARVGGRGLIVLPLGVRQEFVRDAGMLGTPVRFIRRIEEAGDAGIHLTNYETVRDGKLDPQHFSVVSLDEASILRGFGGTKTFREFMALFAGDDRSGQGRASEIRYRFVATATPSPNNYIELLSYAAFLGIQDVGTSKTKYFQRNSEKNDDLTLYPHHEAEFWKWIASWALFLQTPSDICECACHAEIENVV